jgi:hypothetical protein
VRVQIGTATPLQPILTPNNDTVTRSITAQLFPKMELGRDVPSSCKAAGTDVPHKSSRFTKFVYVPSCA